MSTNRLLNAAANPPLKRKKTRDRRPFKSNHAASLALPEHAPRIIKTQPISFTDSLSRLANSIHWLALRTPDAIRNISQLSPEQFSFYKLQHLTRSILAQFANLPKLNLIAALTQPKAITNSSTVSIRKQIADSQSQINKLRSSSHPKAKEKIEEEERKQIELLKPEIIEHAARRVDLFFYLLVAVYRKQIKICKDHTDLQNGIGNRQTNTQACHSSLFPNIRIEALPTSDESFLQKTSRWLTQVFQQNAELPVLKGTHFDESLNATTELPKLVNDFDGHLEGGYQFSNYVESCTNILNRAAIGKITPIEGMHLFFNRMNDFFIHYENKYINPSSVLYQKSKKHATAAEKLIWEYQKKGSFQVASPDLRVNMKYVHMMLRINGGNRLFASVTLEPFYKSIQQEIYTSKSSAKQAAKSA